MKKGITELQVQIILLILIIVFLAAILLPTPPRGARTRAREATCQSNQKQIALSFMMYVQENKDIIPAIDENIFTTIGLQGKVLVCPNIYKSDQQSYVVNGILSGLNIGKVESPPSVWLTADAKKGATSPVGYTEADMWARHRGGNVITSYLDGHVEFVKIKEK